MLAGRLIIQGIFLSLYVCIPTDNNSNSCDRNVEVTIVVVFPVEADMVEVQLTIEVDVVTGC